MRQRDTMFPGSIRGVFVWLALGSTVAAGSSYSFYDSAYNDTSYDPLDYPDCDGTILHIGDGDCDYLNNNEVRMSMEYVQC